MRNIVCVASQKLNSIMSVWRLVRLVAFGIKNCFVIFEFSVHVRSGHKENAANVENRVYKEKSGRRK